MTGYELEFGTLANFTHFAVTDAGDSRPTTTLALSYPDGDVVTRIYEPWESTDSTSTSLSGSAESRAVLRINNRLVWELDQAGTYSLLVTATDTSGNVATDTRTLIVSDPRGPQFSMISDGAMDTVIEIGDAFDLDSFDAQVVATDNGENVTPYISGLIDTRNAGKYTRQYTATNASGIANSLIRTVYVVAPMTLNSDNPLAWQLGKAWIDPGAIAWNTNGTRANVATSGVVNTNSAGTYTITYSAKYGSATIAKTRTVNVAARFEAFAVSTSKIKIR